MSEKKGALGFIETVGLVAAIASADAAVKAANVSLIGRENSKGGGLITVKIAGEIGAVNAALSAAKGACEQVSRVWAIHSMARPADGIHQVFGQEPTPQGPTGGNQLSTSVVNQNLAVVSKPVSALALQDEAPEKGIVEVRHMTKELSVPSPNQNVSLRVETKAVEKPGSVVDNTTKSTTTSEKPADKTPSGASKNPARKPASRPRKPGGKK